MCRLVICIIIFLVNNFGKKLIDAEVVLIDAEVVLLQRGTSLLCILLDEHSCSFCWYFITFTRYFCNFHKLLSWLWTIYNLPLISESDIFWLYICCWCVGYRFEATVYETRHKGCSRGTSWAVSLHTRSLPDDVYKPAVDNSPVFWVQHGGREQQVLSSEH